jgi:hypothetical protein
MEYRGAVFSIVYGYIDNILYTGGTVESPVSHDITINWSPCDEGDTIDTFIELLKRIIDFHHTRKALTKAFD